jgi:hypothetical protein
MKTLWLSLVMATFSVQPMAVAQNPLEKKVVDMGDIRITATKKGVVAGRISTKKVIWRYGFDWGIVNNTEFFPDTLIVFEKQLYIKSTTSNSSDNYGNFLSLKNGENLIKSGNLTKFYTQDNNKFYFDNASIPFDFQDNPSFIRIRLFEYNSVTRKTREIVFESDKYIDYTCNENYLNQGGAGYVFLKFQAKTGENLKFVYNSQFCDVEVLINLSDVKLNSVKVGEK